MIEFSFALLMTLFVGSLWAIARLMPDSDASADYERALDTVPAVERRPGSDHNYHAVSVRSNNNCCQAATALAGNRFLAAEAPSLPLQGCDAAKCQCRYVHHADRRTGNRVMPAKIQVPAMQTPSLAAKASTRVGMGLKRRSRDMRAA